MTQENVAQKEASALAGKRPAGLSQQKSRSAQKGSSSKNTKEIFRLLSDAEIDEANTKLNEAFSMLGLFDGTNLVCPKCGDSKKKIVQFKTSKSTGKPYWKCFKCSENGSATKLLQEMGGKTFPEAVKILLGRDPDKKVDIKEVKRIEIAPPFEAVVDTEVYNFIRGSGSLLAAQRYWATWHLPPQAVKDAGSTMITDQSIIEVLLSEDLTSEKYQRAWQKHVSVTKKLHLDLKELFGMDRLFKCGVLSEKGYFLINEDYCVIEPHEIASWKEVEGKLVSTRNVVGMQFRPVGKTKKMVDDHKTWKRYWNKKALEFWPEDLTKKASDAYERMLLENPEKAGIKKEYQTPFLSIRGAGTSSLVGCGLYRAATLETPESIYLVEGFKDHVAGRTLGVESVAMPGTGNMPPEVACDVLKRHDVVVALDGDQAGEKGREAVMMHFSKTYTLTVTLLGKPRRNAKELLENHAALKMLPNGFEILLLEDRVVVKHQGYLPKKADAETFATFVATALQREPLDAIIEEKGVLARIKPGIKEGMDVTDILVERVAHTGCNCPTCKDWRKSNIVDYASCWCSTCKARRENHQFDPTCVCGACLARKAWTDTSKVVKRTREVSSL